MEDEEIGHHEEPPKSRSSLIWGGAMLALLAGLGIAFMIMLMDKGSSKPPPASRGGLVVEAGKPDDSGLDAKPLRCFVDAQFVGEMTLAQCARQNGVATDALDVGLDPTGALAAAGTAGTVLTPLPPQGSSTPTPTPDAPVQVNTATCWSYSRDGWRETGDMPRGACVQSLFAGQCERQGGAQYGRWGDQTLRLVPGRVEISGDNRRFRTLVEQGPGCSLPALD